MYNYEKPLPRGFKIEKEITEGSSAKVYILINNANKKMVRKISDVEGINKNGREKLKKEINFIEYFNSTKLSGIYPKIYNYEANDFYVCYDIEFIEGKLLRELLEKNKKDDIIDCYNKILNDICTYSDIQFINTKVEANCLYDYYINKTKKVIDNILNSNILEKNLIQSDILKINNVEYKNPRIIIDMLSEDKIKNKLIPSIKAFCFHGDLISSNVIYNNGEVAYIDPRGEFSDFDICYDIAKMKFSICGYDKINNNSFKVNQVNNSIDFEIENETYEYINEYFYTLLKNNEKFSNNIIKKDGYWKERIRLHTALQYINNSYIQIKRNEVDKFKIIYAIGTIKLNVLIKGLY